LPSLLQQIDDPVLLIFEINRLPIGQQVELGFTIEQFRKPPSHLSLQEAKDPSHLLEGKALSSEFCDYRDFDYLFRRVDSFMTSWRGDTTFRSSHHCS